MRLYSVAAGLSLMMLAACGGGESAEADVETSAVEASEEGAASAERSTPVPEGSKAGHAMLLGNETAPIQMVEYASVTCPGCAYFHTLAWPVVKTMAIDTGLVQFEHREFPTPPKELAYAGFYLARCTATTAGPNAYYKILDTLYSRQREWAYSASPGDELTNIASQAGLDREGLEDCFFREDIKSAVADNVKAGVEKGVRTTPSFFMGDERYEWTGSPMGMVYDLEAASFASNGSSVPAGTTATISMPIDLCEALLNNTSKAHPTATMTEETDTQKSMQMLSVDGGMLTTTCAAPSADPESHTMVVAKLAAE